MARRQRPKRSKRTPGQLQRQAERKGIRIGERRQSRMDAGIAQAMANGSNPVPPVSLGGVPVGPVVSTPGYPVPLGQSQYPAPLPGTYPPLPGTAGTTELAMPVPQEGTYDWAPEGERHAVTTNQEPSASWPPVDLPPLSGFTTGEVPIDNGQANPETTYGGSADVDTSQYYDYN